MKFKGVIANLQISRKNQPGPVPRPEWANNALPSREEQLKKMANTEFDLLVIGGGATGSGVALDAISRGK